MEDRKQAILDAAVHLADERGLDAVSMRAVAARVGVTPMALYPHVGGKAELLDGMIGQLLGQLSTAPAAPPPPGQPPHQLHRLGDFARAARTMTRQHPWAATLLFSRPTVAPDSVRTIDLIYQELLDAGVPEPEVPRLERLLSTFILGYAASETGGRFGAAALDPRRRREQLPEGALPGHTRLARWLDQHVDWDAEFNADLDDLGRLIEAAAGQAGPGKGNDNL
jgi:AcrR family transcriptional regulator